MTLKIVRFFLVLMLVYLSAEILIRRFLWDQVPTQIPFWIVGLLLLLNAVYLVYSLPKMLKR